MFIVRFLVLLFLAAYGLGMGGEPNLNAFGKFMALSVFVTIPALYLLPAYEAWSRQHQNKSAIGLLNLFLGWTLIGWVVSAVWAFKQAETPAAVSESTAQSSAPTLSPTNSSGRAIKECPFCAEEILAAAIKCKHCGSLITSEQT